MKNISIALFIVCLTLAACYKEQKPLQAFDVLTRHKWKIKAYSNASIDSGANCRVPSEVEFNRDSTGYWVYTSHCTPGDSLRLDFRFIISSDNRNIHYYPMGGGSPVVCGLSDYDDSNIYLIDPSKVLSRYVDGIFTAFGDK